MNIIRHVYKDVNAGLLSSAFTYREEINKRIMILLEIDDPLEDYMVEYLREAIIIGNATYNNSDSDITPIDDGIWDLMVQKYRKYTPDNSYPVGFKPTAIYKDTSTLSNGEKKKLFSYATDEEKEKMQKMLFREEILEPNYALGVESSKKSLFTKLPNYGKIAKRITNITHNHPDLVGTFDKCKFVLNAQAREKGVENDPRVEIMERDYFKPLLDSGIINTTSEIVMIATLKYDGISVEADVTDRVESARTRGDAVEGKATDLTPILDGYRFGKIPPGMIKEPIGMKFEAIINNFNLTKLNLERGCNYKNCRTAMTGIIGSSDAFLYRDLVTLVPISTDYKDENGEPLDRLVEIEFLNRYYTKDQLLRYSVLTGNYSSLLFQIKKFVEEAEFARSYLPFMYDGVVFEFYDRNIREILGRDHAMDRYKCAIKFNPMTKQTIFRGWEYTVGQDGKITPMICYDPVEFFGTIHPNSSGHSYNNFNKLDLRIGDIIDVTYRNDVITYVTKPENAHNTANANKPKLPEEEFITHCPYCGTEIEISESSKTARCPNMDCPERTVQRLATSLERLGVINFGEETVRALGYTSLSEFFMAEVDDFAILGENNKVNLYDQLKNISTTPIYDYKVFSALGFTGIADKTWQLIFAAIPFDKFIADINNGNLTKENFPIIKGIGPSTIDTILLEWGFYMYDIMYLFTEFNIKKSYGVTAKGRIRFTGCRDSELEKTMTDLGYDCSDKGVTKSTDILLVPHEGYNQGNKITKAKQYGIRIVPIQDFKDNPNQYL